MFIKYSKGISWIDDCRIPFVDETILMKSYEANAMDIWYDIDLWFEKLINEIK